ncbi:hypothetical protein, partial [Mycobacterium kansasii]|uniref:hypothetical protein n=1 Tax=Mycobacterium kansasii TaxID=1768 RepID=UPI001A7EE23E
PPSFFFFYFFVDHFSYHYLFGRLFFLFLFDCGGGGGGAGSGVSLITRILLSPATTAKGYGDTTPD